MALFVELEEGDRVAIDNGRIAVTLEKKSGRKARLKIDADKSIKIGKPVSTLTRPPLRKFS